MRERVLHVGIMEWLLVWLILNALFVVWRILVTTDVETRDRSIRKMPSVADLNEKRPQLSQSQGRQSCFQEGLGAEIPEDPLSLPRVCESLRTRGGRDSGADATQSGGSTHGYLNVNLRRQGCLNRV